MSAIRVQAPDEGIHRAWVALEYATLRELERLSDDEIGCAIAAVESEHPQLAWSGWYGGNRPKPTSVAMHPAYRKQVRVALTFVRQHAQSQAKISSASNSDALARIATRWASNQGRANRISHGAFITAAIIAGYKWARYPGSGLTCALNMRVDWTAALLTPEKDFTS